MNKSIIMGLLRHALTTVGGAIAANGMFGLDTDTVQQIVGILMAIAGVAWSIYNKQNPDFQIPIASPKVEIVKEIEPDIRIGADEFENYTNGYDVNKPQGFSLSDRSRKNLVGVNENLQRIVETALELTSVDFAVTEGLRTKERQEEMVKQGKSWIKVSKHQSGEAVDLAAFPKNYPGQVSWEARHYMILNDAMQRAAQIHNARLTWGGHWKQRDYGHFQIEGETT